MNHYIRKLSFSEVSKYPNIDIRDGIVFQKQGGKFHVKKKSWEQKVVQVLVKNPTFSS